MIIRKAPLQGPVVIELDKREDSRGFFARTFCAKEFRNHGLTTDFVQANLSYTREIGTIRGMHYQVAPSCEAKLIRCINGSVWDVSVDMRPDSPTYLHHFGVELSAKRRNAVYVPEMFAHGYMTLDADTELLYHCSKAYSPNAERGVRHDDPAIQINWPLPVSNISDKDQAWPLIHQATCPP